MKHLLCLLLLYAGIAHAQVRPVSLSDTPMTQYPGNPVSLTLPVSTTGTTGSLTAVAYEGPVLESTPPRLVPAGMQPASTTITGGLLISWSGPQSLSLVSRIPNVYLVIRSGGVSIATVNVKFTYTAVTPSTGLPVISISTVTLSDITTRLTPIKTRLDSLLSAGFGGVRSVNGQSGAVTINVPTNNNQLTNGAGYISDSTGLVRKVTGYRLFSGAEATKLAGIEAGAISQTTADGRYRLQSVAITAAQVGLGNVLNVDATQRGNHQGTQAISTVTGLQTALDGKSGKSEVYLDIEVATYTALQTWIAANPNTAAIITVVSDTNNGNGEGVYRFRKGILKEFFLL